MLKKSLVISKEDLKAELNSILTGQETISGKNTGEEVRSTRQALGLNFAGKGLR